MSELVDKYAKIIWDYLLMEQPLKKVDCMIVMGSIDTRSAERAAELMLEGYAPVVIFSGNQGRNTQGLFDKTEAEVFADIAINRGVSKDKILLEPRATNTGENIDFSLKLLSQKGIKDSSFILVHKAFATKRVYATFKMYNSAADVLVAAPQHSYEEYPTQLISKELFLHTLVGDMQRMQEYPKRGFQIEMPIPDEARKAYQALRDLGYADQISPAL